MLSKFAQFPSLIKEALFMKIHRNIPLPDKRTQAFSEERLNPMHSKAQSHLYAKPEN